jgi:hypothetical protein
MSNSFHKSLANGTFLLGKKELYRQMKIKEMELKELQEQYLKPSEYKILQMISDKYNICPDLEEKINKYLQKIKMKKNIEIFDDKLYYVLCRGGLLKNKVMRTNENVYRLAHDKEHYYLEQRIPGNNFRYNIYGLKMRDDYFEGSRFHWLIKYNQDENRCSKDHLKEYLKQNNIKYLQSDSRHALLCRLMGRNPKDPVYTKAIKQRVAR